MRVGLLLAGFEICDISRYNSHRTLLWSVLHFKGPQQSNSSKAKHCSDIGCTFTHVHWL